MSKLRWIGFVPSLLMVGVLGGLMAPLPSEAFTIPTVSIQIDSGATTPVTLTLYGTGVAAGLVCPAGYSACYKLTTGGTYTGDAANGSRAWQMQDYPGSTATLYVTDQDSSGLDNLTLSTVQFVSTVTTFGSTAHNSGLITCTPVAPATTCTQPGDQHFLKIYITHTFDAVPNLVSQTTAPTRKYAVALQTSGIFSGATSLLNGLNDYVSFGGTGTFDPNVGPVTIPSLSTTFGNTQPSFNYTIPSQATNPSFFCHNRAATNPACTPTVNLTMTTTLYGPDTVKTTSSHAWAGGTKHRCSEVDDDDNDHNIIGNDDDNSLCKSTKKRIRIYMRKLRNIDAATPEFAHLTAIGAVGTACLVNCAPSNVPLTGTGKIVINKTIAPCLTGYTPCYSIPPDTQTFVFTGTGPGIGTDADGSTPTNFNIVTNVGTGSTTFSGLYTGEAGGSRTIKETGFPTNPADPDMSNDPAPCNTAGNCYPEAAWYTQSVTCSPLSSEVVGGTQYTTSIGATNSGSLGVPPSDSSRGGSVTVANLADGDTLTCTFVNGIYEYDESHTPIPVLY